jgi:hypothetical protein
LRGRFIKYFKPFRLYRALVLVVAKFISSYDTFAIDSALWEMAHSTFEYFWSLCARNGRMPKIVQTTLRRCFRSLHKFRWDEAGPDYPRYAEWFLKNSYKCDLLFYFGFAASVNVDCFDFATILNEMVTDRQDLLRELAEDPEIFADILTSLGKLEGTELRQALRRVSDLIKNEGLTRRALANPNWRPMRSEILAEGKTAQ